PADVDGDGRPDLYFVTQLGRNELWKNMGDGRFADVTDQAGVEMPDDVSVAAAFADVDNDGDPDLFVPTVRHGNRLFENMGGGRFRGIAAQAGVGDLGPCTGVVFLDYDCEGLLDLFGTEGGRRLRDATHEYFPKTPWGAMGVKVFDFDGDGRLDLFVTDMHSDMWVNIPPGDWAAEARKADSSQARADYFPDGKARFIFGN